MKWIPMKCLISWLALVRLCLLSALVCISSPSSAAEEHVCKKCHQDVVDGGMTGRVIHKPFLKRKCGACHVAGLSVRPMVPKNNSVDETMPEKNAVNVTMPEKIRWFRDAYRISDRHWVLFGADQVDDTLIYKTWENSSRAPLREISLPSLELLSSKEDDGLPPIISNIRVQDVRRGISTTATIAWDTDEFTDAQVDYGIGTINSSKSTHHLSQEHQIILSGLDNGKIFTFQVISTDLFGNQTQSDVLKFTTEKTFMLPEGRRDASHRAGDEAEVDYQLFRQGGDYLIVFEAERSVSLAIGVPAIDSVTVSHRSPKPDDFNQSQQSHPILKSQIETNILVCYSCHAGNLHQSMSHPVNVLPKQGMVIPKEYPLLADGRLSCMSCHSYHSGNFEYRLLKPDKKSLCTGCHTNY
jgi:predicted CXXCH cytochrome family protein